MENIHHLQQQQIQQQNKVYFVEKNIHNTKLINLSYVFWLASNGSSLFEYDMSNLTSMSNGVVTDEQFVREAYRSSFVQELILSTIFE
jgi:hypothetical protein